MRTYSLANREFNDFDEFLAAKRDLAKIGTLDVVPGDKTKNADAILAQIRERKMSFESELGTSFLENVEEHVSEETKRDFEKQERLALKDSSKRRLGSLAMKTVRVARNTSIMFLGVILVGLVGLLIVNIQSESRGRELYDELRDVRDKNAVVGDTIFAEDPVALGNILPEYAALHEQNPEMTGWLSIDVTPIDYPIMHRADDNDFYLSHNFNGEYDVNGMLVLDKRCDPTGRGTNMLIHGHNMKSGMMFGSLRKFVDQGYCADHKIINMDTLYEKRQYEIISVFISNVSAENTEDFKFYNYINIDNEQAFNEYIQGVKARSVYQTDTTAHYGEKLITLSTCDYSQNQGRLVIVGKQV